MFNDTYTFIKLNHFLFSRRRAKLVRSGSVLFIKMESGSLFGRMMWVLCLVCYHHWFLGKNQHKLDLRDTAGDKCRYMIGWIWDRKRKKNESVTYSIKKIVDTALRRYREIVWFGKSYAYMYLKVKMRSTM